jgi:hypothetical protein
LQLEGDLENQPRVSTIEIARNQKAIRKPTDLNKFIGKAELQPATNEVMGFQVGCNKQQDVLKWHS